MPTLRATPAPAPASGDGNVISVTRTDGATNQVVHTNYTNSGKVASVIDANGNRTTNAYDLNDRLVSVTDPVGRVTSYGYDALSRRASVSNSAIQSNPLVQYGYTADGLLGSLAVARGNTVSDTSGFAYDGFDRLATTTYADSSTETRSYDADDNVLSRNTRKGDTITFTYDTLNRVSTKTPPSRRRW